MNIEIIPVTAFQQNCSLIWDDEKNAAIIDPGGNAEKLIQRIEELELNLKAVLLTHGHLDHVGLLKRFAIILTLKSGAHRKKIVFFLKVYHSNLSSLVYLIFLHLHPIAGLIKKAKKFKLATFTFEILHLPGHTPGHIGFIEHEKNIAFTGDVLFQNSIGRTDFPRGDFDTLISSIKNKLFTLNDDMVVIAGHGPYTTIGQEKRSNPFLK